MNINATLIGQSISFIFFVWFSMRFVWPPIMKALDERKARIAEGLAAAERGIHEQELAKERAKEVLHEAKMIASDIVSQAQKRASEIVEEAKGNARTEGDRLLTAAKAEIEQETNRAREHLREHLGTLVIRGVEKILEKEVDATVHRGIVDKLATEI
ncbi:MAG: F0F1 ATP synthase subunit B [Gammaproteobacteria bacterium]|nr:F0F1 ATP synthase subunit B [Gammaproteobacteria bacterium]MBU1656031.1 F0F1 ATP synthase subunit B [Gammaproteobacteria bacterium]MBU1962239.1 F0F1 ATP synthase subunit B [Gammaproteobacteria bacterium]